MAAKLTQEQVDQFKSAFALFDKDGNGKITVSELGTVMRSVGLHPTRYELEKVIREVDIHKTGYVDLGEFLTMMAKKTQNPDMEEQMLESFRMFDRDGNGFISFQELRTTLNKLGEKVTDEELKDMMKTADLDGDGQINYFEFVTWMTAKV